MAKRVLTLVLIVTVAVFSVASMTSCNKAPEVTTIRVGYGSDIDPADVADQIGYDLLPSQYSVEVSAFNEDNQVIAGLLKGQLDVGNIGMPDTIKAIQMGVPLKVLMFANMRMEYVQIGQPGITKVTDLRGKKVAFHAIGSGTEILPKELVKAAGMKLEDVEWITLPESPNRAAAMAAKRIDSTALEFADYLTIVAQGTDYPVIGSFGETFPQAIASCFVVTEDYAANNPDLLKALAKALVDGFAKADSDKATWVEYTVRMCPNRVDAAKADKTYDFYKKIGMFPVRPIITRDMWDKMNEFYVLTGEYETAAPISIFLQEYLPQ